jgi:hypothetical protein
MLCAVYVRVVCMQLLELSALCLRCEVGRLLCDSRCWEIFQTCHKITCQERVSSLLGNTAGNTLAHIVLMVFSRARQPRTAAAQHVSPSSSKSKHKAITATTAATTGSSATAATAAIGADSNNSGTNIQQQGVHSSAHNEHSASTTTAQLHTGNDSDSSSSSIADECVLVDGVDTGDDGGDEYTEQFHKEQLSKEQLKSHRRRRRRTNRDHSAATTNTNGDSTSSGSSSTSLNALVEIMRFLSRLSNPRENSEETCILSLSLINIALEAGGVQLGQHKALVEVANNNTSRFYL